MTKRWLPGRWVEECAKDSCPEIKRVSCGHSEGLEPGDTCPLPTEEDVVVVNSPIVTTAYGQARTNNGIGISLNLMKLKKGDRIRVTVERVK